MDYYKWSGMLRNYVRSNALCLTSYGFDARSRKIQHVAEPQFDSDAANKSYVQRNIHIIRERLEIIENRLGVIEQEMQSLRNDIDNVGTLSALTPIIEDDHLDIN